jgi:hypothetical protein
MATAQERLTDVAHAATRATILDLLETMGAGAMADRSGDPQLVTSRAILRGLRAVELAAHEQARQFCGDARAIGMSWQQIGDALGLAAEAAGQGVSTGEVAWAYATGAASVDLWSAGLAPCAWTCPGCQQVIEDRGPGGAAAPEYAEPGHLPACRSLAAAEASWESERKAAG